MYAKIIHERQKSPSGAVIEHTYVGIEDEFGNVSDRFRLDGGKTSLPSPAFAGHGSYQGISCRQRRSCTTVGDDPGCVRTRSLFSKIEFPSEFRSDEASGGHSIRDYGQNRENNFLQFSSRQVFTQPGPRAETAATCRLHPDPHPQKSGFSACGTLVSLWS